MPEFSGWHLPDGDGYFSEFLRNGQADAKVNGFQRHHLLTAFEHVKQWRLALDIGAHVGFWTLDMAERFERVLAFEPSTTTHECLVKNMADHTNVEIFKAAVGEEAGTCTIVDDAKRPRNTGSRHVQEKGKDVQMITIDSLGLPCCDFIKLDVEGYELKALRGARKLILKHRPVIIMETDKRFAKRFAIPDNAAERFLTENGYREVAHMRPDKVFVSLAQSI